MVVCTENVESIAAISLSLLVASLSILLFGKNEVTLQEVWVFAERWVISPGDFAMPELTGSLILYLGADLNSFSCLFLLLSHRQPNSHELHTEWQRS